ncbi:condensation domain-containing protein, partial [Bradyrhizobium sp. PRIMUS42]|uniref:condensation domain-containing protein n=1 Tax=Bradyrhizobium sp. PRIMUS42 TaxID=2908926 RepID=UPI001FF2932D
MAETLEIERAELLALLMKAGAASAEPQLRPRDHADPAPLSFAQERLWVLDQLQPGGSEYNIPVFVRLNGELDQVALDRSLDELMRRHETLRMRTAVEDGEPAQIVEPHVAVELVQLDLTELAGEAQQSELRHQLAEFTGKPFDLAVAPLFRAALLKLSEQDHVILLVLHHMIFDGWSLGILIRDLSALYTAYSRGTVPSLPPLAIQYADYAIWQRQRLQGAVLERQLSYWRSRFSGVPAMLDLPTDRP